jgi:hypothetical protein
VRIGEQKSMLSQVSVSIDKSIKDWKYASYQLCAGAELTQLGFSAEGATKNHAVIFYYKKLEG